MVIPQILPFFSIWNCYKSLVLVRGVVGEKTNYHYNSSLSWVELSWVESWSIHHWSEHELILGQFELGSPLYILLFWDYKTFRIFSSTKCFLLIFLCLKSGLIINVTILGNRWGWSQCSAEYIVTNNIIVHKLYTFMNTAPRVIDRPQNKLYRTS